MANINHESIREQKAAGEAGRFGKKQNTAPAGALDVAGEPQGGVGALENEDRAEAVWAQLAQATQGEPDGTAIRVPVEDIRALLATRPASPCEHVWQNRVGGGSKCVTCGLWQDKRVPLPSNPREDRSAIEGDPAQRTAKASRDQGPPRGWRVVDNSSGAPVSRAFDTEEIANRDCAARNMEAYHRGQSGLYGVEEVRG